MSNCNCHQEIIRDGSGRLTRFLKALDPSYAPIDDRSLEELLVFIQKYAARIRFYDVPESKVEDGIPLEKVSWENFFKRDMAVIIASMAITDTGTIKKDYDEIRSSLESLPDADKLAKLFTASIALGVKINNWHTLAIQTNPLYNDLEVAIHSTLAMQLRRIMAYEEGYKLINAQKPLNLNYGSLDNNEFWGTDQPINADASVYEGDTPEEKILNAALFADEIFNGFLASINGWVNKSDAYLQFALEQYPAHQPHIALFIAFLKLFQLAQQQMNGLTARLLDYYYKEVLQLTAKKALPDKAHVVFELAKNVMEYDLVKRTLLKAGKDVAGVDQIYATDDDLVINQARVKEIKTVFIEKTDAAEGDKTVQTIYANPVASSADGAGKPFETEADIKWKTFGGGLHKDVRKSRICRALGQLNEEDATFNYAMPGFAVASPQLVLGGGNRLVALVSDGIGKLVKQLQGTGPANPLSIWLTGEKGWLKINRKVEEAEIAKILRDDVFNSSLEINEPVYGFFENELIVFLPLSIEAVVGFNTGLHQGYQYATGHPVMQVMLNPEFNFPEAVFSQLTFTNISIKVKVGSINRGKTGPLMDGLQSLILQNDEQMLPPGKAFNPFTFLAGTGKSFYIGSEEAFNKPLKQLSVNIRSTLDNTGRSVTLFVLKNKQWILLKPNNDKDDFSYTELSQGVLEYYLTVNEKETLERQPIVKLTEWTPSVLKGFLRLDNKTSFMAGEFPEQLTPQELAARLEIKEVSISYTSELQALEEGTDLFFHVYPFGVAEIGLNNNERLAEGKTDMMEMPEAGVSSNAIVSSASGKAGMNQQIHEFHPGNKAISDQDVVDAGKRLLPQFTFTGIYDFSSGRDAEKLSRLAGQRMVRTPKLLNALAHLTPRRGNINQYSGNIQEEGILFIGLENARPLQSVSMLFQFAEGSADDEDNDPPQIHWSYLSHNQWRPLPGENLITDGTYGFQTTGIIRVSIPRDATNGNTIITPGLHWIRASVTENANRIPMLINIITQAVLATFVDNKNSAEHYDQALAAASISKLKIPASQVSKVSQPFASFDGRHKEIGNEFYTRVSERLRHKQRAVTAWDYEHLILDRFPSVYKVKCITHTDPNCLCRKKENGNDGNAVCCGQQIAPGHVLLIPVANLKNRNGVDPLQPKTARRVLIEMVDYVKGLASPFVKVYAKNPVYEQIIVFFRVKFITGTDIGFYLKKLNDEIVAYLTPWAFDDKVEVIFGQKVYASSIINFIEERSYVDFITDFEMGVCKEECCPPNDNNNKGNDESAQEVISRFSNCNDVEKVLSESVEDRGEIVAKPSSARSILVSAPHHIIVPYEALPVLSPCEQKKVRRKEAGIEEGNHVVKIVPKDATIGYQNNSLEIKSKTEIIRPKSEAKGKTGPSIIKKADSKKPVVKAKKGKQTIKERKATIRSGSVKNKKSDKPD